MNYNTLRNKPTINYRELIGDSTVSEVGGITEEEFNTLMSTDLASYYTKAQIDDLFSRSYVYREKSGSIVTFDCPSTPQSIPELSAEIVAVQSGTGDPSPTNVRPITGWSAVNRYRTGKNLFNIDAEHTTSDATYQYNLKVKPNTAYTLSSNVPQDDVASLYFNGGSTNVNGVWSGTSKTFTSDADGNLIVYVRYYATSQGGIDLYTAVKNGTYYIQLEEGSVDTEYEPFGATYTTTLKDGNNQPLTCYGGELQNVNGVQTLTVTHGYIASYNGETLPSTWISDRDVYAAGTTPTTGAEVVYLLETPTQITQDTLAISSGAGTNNIWCDSGDITVKALDKIIQG